MALDIKNVLIAAYGDDTHGTDVRQAYLFDAITWNSIIEAGSASHLGDVGLGRTR